MNAIAMNIEDELAEELNVVNFPGRRVLSELEQLADVHRREAAVAKQRIADRKRSLKAELANLALARRIAKGRFENGDGSDRGAGSGRQIECGRSHRQ
ncbi:hypothetical protein ACHMW4_04175 [Mesorhizobium sp. UC22_110]|uniref:hypothetical protein n=1 Tax=Mesorhizobium sp. UC22_110 TaxID=3374552 RepID=UPI0037576068